MANQLGNLKLRDMSLTRSEKVEKVTHDTTDIEDYPWGLRLNLDQDAIDKLGIDLPSVGDTFFVVALAKVRSISEFESDDETRQDISLQIEQLSLDGEITKS